MSRFLLLRDVMALRFSENIDFVGFTTTLRTAYERASLASESRIPVFLLGEPGVGKETFARAIAEGAFVKLRCDLLAPRRWTDLLSGAFDGFPFEFSDSAALFLEGIETVPKAVQRRFAAIVRSASFKPRVLLSSTVPYRELRERGVFAPEFDALLTAFPIFLPPLRDRGADVAELAAVFLRDACRRLGVWPRGLTERELDQIRKTEFPDNLDGLRRLMEHAALSGSLPREAPERAPDLEREPARTPPSARQTVPIPEEENDGLFLSLDESISRHIERALRLTNGVVEGKNGAAALLQINPYTLRSRMRKMKIDWTKFRDES